jgi:NAD(P)-dependent dehydrogenase (short-subunit alcohol dehydrogenase family)
MDLGVRDRGYLIVGGTAGMGLAAASVLAADGARVALVGRDANRAAVAAETIRSHGGSAVAFEGDVTRAGEAERIVAVAVDALGDLAGVAVTTGTSVAVHTDPGHSSDEVWAEAFDDILMGTVRTVRAAIPRLVAAGGGTVVTTAAHSIHSYHPARVPYVTMKSGVAAFTKSIARAYGSEGVRANCICPGAIETGSLAAVRAQLARTRGIPPEGLLEKVMVEEWHMDVALGRLGHPEEVGELFAFLLSPRAAYLTGAIINMDGGTDF